VTSSGLGAAWPLTSPSARLECDPQSKGIPVAVALVDGRRYALNGLAKHHGYPGIEPVWAHNPSIPGTRKNIGPLIERALKLCER